MRVMLRVVMVWVFLVTAAAAQLPLNLARSGCRGDQPRIYAELPAMVQGGGPVMVPMCLQLGPLLSVDTSTDPPTLRAAIISQTMPWIAMDRIDLVSLPATTGSTLVWTLGRVPLESSAIIAVLQGRPYGLVEAAVSPMVPGSRQVSITLPSRPFTAGDAIVLLYLTTETRPMGAVVVPTPAPAQR